MGCTPGRLFLKYYFPVIMPHIIVQLVHDFGRVLFMIAQLGIIHIFVQYKFIYLDNGSYKVENTSNAWPTLFSNITQDIRIYRWIPYTVLAAMGLTILALNLFADGLQKHFEKKHRTFRAHI
ncbi:ABC transporter permease subunit [Neobacillus sp. PS3-34]|uniref:ABC transporter permease subunit n=1 Tax=Neobacillus sp. PS3-34 TaxID=3070678 RepID=UPI0027DF1C4C|nr:ABC transporter permease subunit [Neobacillus sp. PS3-34]WML50580.1 ABC transporter permease subunit [Neobacillus sp. PS3-34]